MSDGVLQYGGNGLVSVSAESENFAGAAFSTFSLGCTPIELLANDDSDTILSTATGFFWQKDGQPHLVTNWHVVSGRNAFTKQLNPDGFQPRRLAFYGLCLSTSNGVISFRRQRFVIKWDDDMIAMLGTPPEADGQPLDIWGVPIMPGIVFGRDQNRSGFKGASEATCFLNDHPERRIATNVGDDCFILGYPLRIYHGLMPPIWKRGSIASEPSIGVDGRPIFLIDAATTAGMSGSPILRKAGTMFLSDDFAKGAAQEHAIYSLIGIYAGRLGNVRLEAVNLGYGWYRTMIDRAISYYGYRGSVKFGKIDNTNDTSQERQ